MVKMVQSRLVRHYHLFYQQDSQHMKWKSSTLPLSLNVFSHRREQAPWFTVCGWWCRNSDVNHLLKQQRAILAEFKKPQQSKHTRHQQAAAVNQGSGFSQARRLTVGRGSEVCCKLFSFEWIVYSEPSWRLFKKHNHNMNTSAWIFVFEI